MPATDDSVPYAQLIVIARDRPVREFLQDEQDSAQDVNDGQFPGDTGKRTETIHRAA
jgi:hypothetical protein